MRSRTALLSVYHKDGITEFAGALRDLGITIYASGGTARHLAAADIDVIDVATIVGSAILGHRVVTLSREIHAGLLSRNIEEDIRELEQLGLPRIDIVCVDLYPLQAEIAREGSTRASVIEQTDIGGPTMIRSGVKGQRLVICDPSDRDPAINWLLAHEPEDGTVERLAAKAEFVIAQYCLTSATYLSNGKYFGILGQVVYECKYGENAWQVPGRLISTGSTDPLAIDKFVVQEGAPLSSNNLADIDRLLQTMTHIAEGYMINQHVGTAIAVGVKHGNSCGTAAGPNSIHVLERMVIGDPVAIFGGLVMVNFPLDTSHVDAFFAGGKRVLLDGIIAPSFSQDAIAALRRKDEKCRFVTNPALLGPLTLDMAPRWRYVRGGVLVQPNYTFVPDFDHEQVVKHRKASVAQECDMMLAWAIGSTSNSNTITLVKDEMLLGNGVGQQDRVGAAQLAITRARRSGHDLAGATAYSDSFFPFPDGPQALIDAGITAIFTTTGSVRDQETIDLCTMHGVALYTIDDKIARGFYGH